MADEIRSAIIIDTSKSLDNLKRLEDEFNNLNESGEEFKQNQSDIEKAMSDNAISALNNAKSIGEMRKAIKEVTSLQLKGILSESESRKLSSALGEAKDKVADLREETAAMAGTRVEILTNNFSRLRESIFNLDLDKFKSSLAGMKQGLTAGEVGFKGLGKAITATGIGALVVAVGLLIAHFDTVKQVLTNLIPGFGKLAKFIGDIVDKVTDFVGLTSPAMREYEKRIKEIDDALKYSGDSLDEWGRKKLELQKKLFEDRLELEKRDDLTKQEKMDRDKALLRNYNAELIKIDKERTDAVNKKKAEDDGKKKAEDEKKAKEEEKAEKEALDAEKAAWDKKMEEDEKREKEIIEKRKENFEKEKAEAEKRNQEGRLLAAKNFADGKITKEQYDAELLRLENVKNQEIITSGEKYYQDITAQRNSLGEAVIKAVLKTAEDEKKVDEATLENKKKITESVSSITNQVMGLMSDAEEFNKGIALGQVAFDTGVAITKALSNSQSATGDNIATGGLAGIAKFAALASVVIANSIKAVNIIKSKKTPSSAGGGGGSSMPTMNTPQMLPQFSMGDLSQVGRNTPSVGNQRSQVVVTNKDIVEANTVAVSTNNVISL